MAKKLMRFMTLRSLVEIFEWGGIPLFDGSHWNDRCDLAFLERGCRELGGARFGVICFFDTEKRAAGSEDVDETDRDMLWETSAHWEVYARGAFVDDPEDFLNIGVAVKFDCQKLFEAAKKSFEKNAWFFAKMNYAGFQAYRKGAPNGKQEWLFLKRDAFEWENEMRLVALDQPECMIPTEARKNGAKAIISLEKDVIESVTFSPLCKSHCAPRCVPSTECIQTQIKHHMVCRRKRNGDVWSADSIKMFNELLENSHRSGIFDNKSVLNVAGACLVQAPPPCTLCSGGCH